MKSIRAGVSLFLGASYLLVSCGGGGQTDAPAPSVVPAPSPSPTPQPSPSPSPGDPSGFPPGEYEIPKLTPVNYKLALSRTYRAIVEAGLSGYVGNGPDPDTEVCTSGTHAYRLEDKDGDKKPSAGDAVEKTYANCQFTATNGQQTVDGTAKFELQAVDAQGSATRWRSSGFLTLIDQSSSACAGRPKGRSGCMLWLGPRIGKTASAGGTMFLTEYRLLRYNWLGSDDMTLATYDDSIYRVAPSAGGRSFGFTYAGKIEGGNLFGNEFSAQRTANSIGLGVTVPIELTGNTATNGGYASAGQLKLRGDSPDDKAPPQAASFALLTAGSGVVTLDLDEDGDGNYEHREMLPWTVFIGL